MQYIGARYVPIWYQNSVDQTSNWEINVEYEPLTFVTSQNNHLYLSKKTVPDNIGTPADNTEYWLDMGVFSAGGSIQELQDEVDALDDRVDAVESAISGLGDDTIYERLQGKKIIVLGDSLTIGSGSALGSTWVELLATKYGATCVNEGVSGSSIAGSTYPDSFINRIDGILSANPTCDYFIISGGANDKNRSIPLGSINTTNIESTSGALKTIIDKVKKKYGKNCKILTMTTYHRYDDTNSLGYCEYDYVQTVLNASSIVGVPCFNNYDNIGLTLLDEGTANAWADVGYVDSGVRSYHFSADAYSFMLPIYAAFIAVSTGNNNTHYPVYSLSSTQNYHRIIENDSFMRTDVCETKASVHFSDLGNHVAVMDTVDIAIPNTYGMSDVRSIQITGKCADWNILLSCRTITIGSTQNIVVRCGGCIFYGSSAPTTATIDFNIQLFGY